MNIAWHYNTNMFVALTLLDQEIEVLKVVDLYWHESNSFIIHFWIPSLKHDFICKAFSET